MSTSWYSRRKKYATLRCHFKGRSSPLHPPFFYFADFGGELSRLTSEGRAKELSQFLTLAEPQIQALSVNPAADPATFARFEAWPFRTAAQC
jgi:hypothetical protein